VDLSPKGPDCKLIQFSSQKPLKRVEVAGPVTPEVREEIMGLTVMLKRCLKKAIWSPFKSCMT